MNQRLNTATASQGDVHRLDAWRVPGLAAWIGSVFLILMLAFSLGGGNGFSPTERSVENDGGALAVPVDRAQELGRTVIATAMRTRPTPVGTGGGDAHKPIAGLVPVPVRLAASYAFFSLRPFSDPTHIAANGLLTRRMTAGPPRA